MSNYTDRFLKKAMQEKQLKEAKEAESEKPLAMAATDDAEVEMDFDSDVTDAEYAENYFNDEASGDEVNIDLDDESEADADEEADTVEDLRKKEQKERKKKRGHLGELEEEQTEDVYIYTENTTERATPEADLADDLTVSDHISYDDIIDSVVQSETYDEQVAREQAEQQIAVASAEVAPAAEPAIKENTFDEQALFDAVVNEDLDISSQNITEVEPVGQMFGEADRTVEHIAAGDRLQAEQISENAEMIPTGDIKADNRYDAGSTPADQSSYITDAGSSAGYDSRMTVADMVPDEQIQNVTYAYTSDANIYAQEFVKMETSMNAAPEANGNIRSEANMEVAPAANDYETLETSMGVAPAVNGYETPEANMEVAPAANENVRSEANMWSAPAANDYEASVANVGVAPAANEVQTSETAKQQAYATYTSDHSDAQFTSSTQENEARYLTNEAQSKAGSTASNSVEQQKTAQDFNMTQQFSLHQFSDVANVVSQRLQQVGDTAIHFAEHEIATADKNTEAGFDSLKKMTAPLAEAATIVGLASLASAYNDQLKQLAKAGTSADKLIADGKLSVDDLLLSKHELSKRLQDAGVSAETKQAILHNREEIHGMMGVRSEMQSMAETGQLKLDDKLSDYMKNGNFYNLTNAQSGNLLQMYFKNSTDDTVRNVFGKGNFTGKSAGTFHKFVRNMDKNEVSANGQAAVRMGQMVANHSRANREFTGHVRQKLKASLKTMVTNVTQYDDKAQSGMQAIGVEKRIAGMFAQSAKKMFIGTRDHGYKGLATQSLRVVKKVMIGTRKHGYKGVATQIGRGVIRFGKYTDKSIYTLTNHSLGHMLKVTKDSVNATRAKIKQGGEIAKKKAIATAKKARDKALNTAVGKQVVAVNNARINATNAAVSKYRSAQKAARKAAQAIAQTKAAKAAYATGNIVAKGTDLVVGTPLRFGAGVFRKVKLGVGKVFHAINAFKKAITLAVGMFCLVYVLLVLITMGMMSIFNQETQAVMNIFLPERDEFIPESIQRYLEKSEDIKDDAEDVGTGVPITPEVTAGHTIDRYGHPDSGGTWVDGYKIYYTDGNGNVIQDGSNNVKDTLVLAYVQMDADWDIDDERNATKLMDKYFAWLNPDADHDTLLQNCEESDIYSCPVGCETVYYVCNDSATLTDTTRSYKSQADIISDKNSGTKFYSDIVSNEGGDYYIATCQGHSRRNPDGTITHYNHGSKTNAMPCGKCTVTHYCTGHSIKACYGHRDVKIYIPIKTMHDAFDENYMASEHSFLTFLNGSWTDDDIEWAESLYDGDWFELYGKDPSGGIGFTPGGSMTDSDIDDVVANVGNVSEVRQKILQAALSQVGVLPYYYGGKPTSGGIPIQTNRGTAGSHTNIPDHIGRTTAGLDCFGFVQWCYWQATGSNILPEGSMYTTTSVYNSEQAGNLRRISASELQVGDLGFQAGHVGLFAGVVNGRAMWVHCNGSASTVSYAAYGGFSRYYRLNALD